MAFAPNNTYFDCGDGSIVGGFSEKSVGNFFEFSENRDGVFEEFPHKVWVTAPREGIDSGFRYAVVKKTVAYVAVDEDENGPVVEKWSIKEYREYDKEAA